MKQIYHYKCPIGTLWIEEEKEAITGISIYQFEHEGKAAIHKSDGTEEKIQKETKLIKETYYQLSEYFQGKRKKFDIPVHWRGTEFQEKVWSALQQIPYGEICSYSDIAQQIGNPKAVRAVGGANHKNRILILVPCHRVIGKNGSLVGFGGGLDVKKYLLDLEGIKGAKYFLPPNIK